MTTAHEDQGLMSGDYPDAVYHWFFYTTGLGIISILSATMILLTDYFREVARRPLVDRIFLLFYVLGDVLGIIGLAIQYSRVALPDTICDFGVYLAWYTERKEWMNAQSWVMGLQAAFWDFAFSTFWVKFLRVYLNYEMISLRFEWFWYLFNFLAFCGFLICLGVYQGGHNPRMLWQWFYIPLTIQMVTNFAFMVFVYIRFLFVDDNKLQVALSKFSWFVLFYFFVCISHATNLYYTSSDFQRTFSHSLLNSNFANLNLMYVAYGMLHRQYLILVKVRFWWESDPDQVQTKLSVKVSSIASFNTSSTSAS